MLQTDWIQFFLPGKIHLEYDSLPKLGEWIAPIGRRILILKENDSEINYTDEIRIIDGSLKKYTDGAIIYDDLSSNPTIDEIDSAAYFVKQSNADAILIAGSLDIINIGKAIAILTTNRILAAEFLQGSVDFRYDALPIITVPMEPTMGEELLGSFIITDKDQTELAHVSHESLVPQACFYDPKLSIKLSKERASWVLGGLICYCIESATSGKINPFTETLLIQALTYIEGKASNFYKEPYKPEFSTDMFWSSAFLGACINSSPLGINWAFAKVLNKFFNINFYHALCILLPYVMEYHLTSNPQIFINIAKVLGEVITDLSKIEAAIRSVEGLKRFFSRLDMPTSLSQINVDKQIIPLASALTMKLPQINNTPKQVNKEVLESILLSAME